jgi:hypothetical protein
MIYRTMEAALAAPRPAASWITRVFVPTSAGGREFVRTYDFNSSRHQCKRCRHATGKRSTPPQSTRRRSRSTGSVCESCGNPYAGFVRPFVYRDADGQYRDNPHAMGGGARIH